AALFHDTGKAWDEFQARVNPDIDKDNYNIGHDFLSVCLFAAFVNNRSTNEWLADLKDSDINIDDDLLNRIVREKNPYTFLKNCFLAKTVGWLILTHHKMPDNIEKYIPNSKKIENYIEHSKQPYRNFFTNDNPQGKIIFSRGHVWNKSKEWQKKTVRYATKALRF
ncbi:MAG: hypothetical protein ACOC2E_06785, partial [Bacteroidota bacterium]